MNGHWKLIYGAYPVYFISSFLQNDKVACEAGRFTGDVDEFIDTEVYDFFQCFRVNTVARRIKDDEVRLFFDFIDDFENIACDKLTVFQSVEGCVLLCCLDCLFYDFYADYFLGNGCQHLGNRSRSAV